MATRVERSVFRLLPFPVRLLAHNAGEAGFEPATFSFACNFRSIAWHKVSITRVERSVFSQFLAVAFTIWLLPGLVGEAGFEPALILVTPGRLRNAKSEKTHHASGWKYFVSAPD